MVTQTLKSMKTYIKMASITAAALFCCLNSSNVFAFDYEQIMGPIDEDIKNTGTSARITQPMQWSDDECTRTNPLALAICKADGKRLENFLKIITNPDDPNFLDINSPDLLVQGFRQTYNLVSLAADPVFPFKEAHPLEERLKIIDYLATTGINFNFRPTDASRNPIPPSFTGSARREYPGGPSIFSHYYEPPLKIARAPSHGDWKGVFSENEEAALNGVHVTRKHMQARVLLYGGDPTIGGTCSYNSIDAIYLSEVAAIARQQIMNNISLIERIRPTEYVKYFLEHSFLAQVKKRYEEHVKEETKKYAGNLAEEGRKYEEYLAEEARKYEEKLARKKREYEEILAREKRKHEENLERVK